jgi:uncharacterized protein (TIGR02001 family)
MRSTLLSSILLAGTALAATPALADDAPASPFTITGSAAVVSQYRFRGISQSDNKPAVQASFTVAHSSGFYVSTWGSSASADPLNLVNIGGTEIDVYGGYTHGLGKSGVTIDLGLYGYIYPGSTNAVGFSENYYEAYGSLSKSFGPIGAKVGVYYAPNQALFDNLGGTNHNLYAYGELSYTVPVAPITVHGHVGHTGGGFDYFGKQYWDYNVGVGYKWKALTFDVTYVGTDVKKSYTNSLATFDNGEGGTTFDSTLARGLHRAIKPVFVGSITASF